MRAFEVLPLSCSLQLSNRRTLVVSRVIRSLFIASVVVSGSAFFASSADASCGDWLAAHVDTSATDHASPDLADARGQSDARPSKKPCDGASCGRLPSFPLLPTNAPTVLLDFEQDAYIEDWTSVSPAGPWATAAVADFFFPATLAERLERPPRWS